MQKTPSTLRQTQGSGQTGEWGEFFPVTLSPFAFNETVAQEYFPLAQQEVLQRGWQWRPDDKKQFQPQRANIPSQIKEVQDELCNEVLACAVTGRNYRIIPQELAFYRKMGLPIPLKHPDQRHVERIEKRNPRQLFSRPCDRCKKTLLTSYPPERQEPVYCEECYLKEVY